MATGTHASTAMNYIKNILLENILFFVGLIIEMRPTRKRSRRTRRTRRGGDHEQECTNTNAFKHVKEGKLTYKWPNATEFPDGCMKNTIELITVNAGTQFDRFGGTGGQFGSPYDKKWYSYNSRALPYLQLVNKTGKTCSNVYKNQRNKMKDYHIYKVLQPITEVNQCTATPAFGKTGKAIQWKFPMSIQAMIDDKFIKEMPDAPPPPFT